MATQAGKLRHTLVARKALLPLNLLCASLTDFWLSILPGETEEQEVEEKWEM